MREWWSSAGLTGAGVLRVGLGASLLARPAGLATTLGVDSATAGRVSWAGSMIGVRDVALGAGLVHAARRGHDPRPWLLAQAASDAVDAAAFGAAVARGHARPIKGLGIAVFAAVGALAEAQAYRGLTKP